MNPFGRAGFSFLSWQQSYGHHHCVTHLHLLWTGTKRFSPRRNGGSGDNNAVFAVIVVSLWEINYFYNTNDKPLRKHKQTRHPPQCPWR